MRARGPAGSLKMEVERVMTFWISWGGVFLVLVALAAFVSIKLGRPWWGIFIDSRNTWSLSQFQLVCWTFLGLPLLVATAIWRSTEDAATAWDFHVPGELLALMGITIGSAVTSLAIKSTKDETRAEHIAAREASLTRPPFYDMLAVEEGTSGLKAIDVTKFQNFVITIGLLLSYLWIVVQAFAELGQTRPDSLPELSQAMVGLLAVSHGGYLAGKLPNRTGNPADDSQPGPSAQPGVASVPGADAQPTTPVGSKRPVIVTVANLT